METFKIATYNVNSIRSRLHIVIPWLRENRPDILCMQETKVDNDHFPVGEFNEAGYHVFFHGGKQYNGVAIASLTEPQGEVFFGLPDDPPDKDRLLMASFAGVTVLNTYIPQGRDRENQQFQYKIQWFKRLRTFLENAGSPDSPIIWCGDLNVAPEAIDVHDPKRLLGHVCFTPEVWEAFDLLKAWGFTDIFRKFYPGKPEHYTFFDYRVPSSVERKLGWRIDHILATQTLAEKSLRCAIDIKPRLMEKPSDHTIMFAEFALRGDMP
jgi:exodeoxyribonuclease-3